MTEEQRLEKKIKVAICEKGCGRHILVAALPHAEINKDSVKAFAKCARAGCEIDYIKLKDMEFGCQCQ